VKIRFYSLLSKFNLYRYSMNGACGSCSSSTATLKGGIEKHLIKVFGKEAVKEVVNLDGSEPGSALSLSREAVVAHLEKLSAAIYNYGGSVEVLKVEDGVCSLEFSGPVALAQSIASSIKGKFPLVKECKIKQVG
jgi:Fe-S cluster biogenesis protein NfuA